ncbi:MAG TPA: hypothetical protein VLI07_01135 [Candidatus Binatus sp.]|nr:hypothetical protein [Candidatus Binatus sp.]
MGNCSRKIRPLVLALCAYSSLATGDRAASGMSFSLLHELQKPTPLIGDHFGSSVAGVGMKVLVGAPDALSAGVDAGTAYLFDARTGSLLLTFQKPAPTGGEQFGLTVAAAGDNVLVAAPSDAQGGHVYLFDGTTGALLRTFADPAAQADDQFGAAIAWADGKVLIGAPGDQTGGLVNAGAAYLFDTTTGARLQTLRGQPAPTRGTQFGSAVAAGSSHLLIGSPLDDFGPHNGGAAYLFDSAGTFLQTFLHPDARAGDRLGSSLAIAGDRFVLGAPLRNTAGSSNSGEVFVFDEKDGTIIRDLPKPASARAEGFGSHLAMMGSDVLVGAPNDDLSAVNGGSAFLYDTDTGGVLWSFESPRPGRADRFGTSISSTGALVIVGAPKDDANAQDAGTTFVFLGTGTPCQSDADCRDPSFCNGTEVCGADHLCAAGAPACDDGDVCSVDSCTEEGGCVNTPFVGFAAMECRLAAMESTMLPAAPEDLGGRRFKGRLVRVIAQAQKKLIGAQTRTGKFAVGRLNASERKIAKFERLLNKGLRAQRINVVLGQELGGHASKAMAEVPALRTELTASGA